MEHGADVNAFSIEDVWADPTGSPLHFLCRTYYLKRNRMIDLIRFFLDNGTDVNTCTRGWTPLLLTCAFHDNDDQVKDIIKLLIEKGADVNAKNESGLYPLHFLCSTYYKNIDDLVDVINLLIEKGADINAVNNEDGSTPLHYLCQFYGILKDRDGLMDLVNLLTKKGADTNAKNEKGETPAYFLRQRGRRWY